MYAVTATVNGKQIPAFYLDENVQGIVDEDQARQIAEQIITTAMYEGVFPHPHVEITVVKL